MSAVKTVTESAFATRETAMNLSRAAATATAWHTLAAALVERLPVEQEQLVIVPIYGFQQDADNLRSIIVTRTISRTATLAPTGYLGRQGPPRSSRDFTHLDELFSGDAGSAGFQLNTTALLTIAQNWANHGDPSKPDGRSLSYLAQALTLALAARSRIALSGLDF